MIEAIRKIWEDAGWNFSVIDGTDTRPDWKWIEFTSDDDTPVSVRFDLGWKMYIVDSEGSISVDVNLHKLITKTLILLGWL